MAFTAYIYTFLHLLLKAFVGFIPPDQIEKVLEATDIAELIGSFVALKPKGRNLFGLSPFTQEKTPSFSVSQEKQFFKCFSTGNGGNAIKFLMLVENLTFVEAIETLAERAGITLAREGGFQRDDDKNKVSKSDLAMLMRLASKFYHQGLLKSAKAEAARQYVNSRNINQQSVDMFQLGFSPDDWSVFSDFATKRGVSVELLKSAGLADISSRGSLYDRFRSRLMFPIENIDGKTIAFGARTMGDDGPKYLNSPETPLFHKSRTLYGLNLAKQSIKDQGFAIVMEGYTDVIAAHQAGVTNAVATLGTAMTKEHARLISRFCQKIIVMYDADDAGVNAANRSINLLLAEDLDVRILILPEKMDPAEFLNNGDLAGFNALLPTALSLIEFKLNHLRKQFDINTPTGKSKAGHEVLNLLTDISDKIRRDIILSEFCSGLHINQNSLRDALNSKRRPTRQISQQVPSEEEPPPEGSFHQAVALKDQFTKVEKMVLKLLINYPNNAIGLLELDIDQFESVAMKRLFELLGSMIANNEYSPSKLLGRLGNQRQDWSNFIADMIDNPETQNLDQEQITSMVNDCGNYFAKIKKDKDLHQLKDRIRVAQQNATENPEALNQLLSEYQNLNKVTY